MGMAVDFSMPFNGDTTEGAPGFAGPYSAENHSNIFRYGLTHLENVPDRGPMRDTLNEWQIAAVGGSLVVAVDTGSAWVRGTFALSTGIKTVTVPPNATGFARRDMLVLRRDGALASNDMELIVLTGDAVNYPTPTQSPLDTGIFEIPLWKWETPNAAADLVGVTFIDLREWANLPRLIAGDLINNGGTDVIVGSVVVQDTGASNSYITTTTVDNPDVIGVTIGGETAAGTTGRVVFGGIVTVRTTGVVARGDGLVTSGTAGVAQAADLETDAVFARALTASAGGLATVQALLLLPVKRSVGCRASGNPTIGSGAWTNLVLNSEFFDTDAMHDVAVQPQRITIQIDGIYHLRAWIRLSRAAGTNLAVRITDGAGGMLSQDWNQLAGAGVPPDNLHFAECSLNTLVNAGTIFDIQAYQNTGGNVTLLAFFEAVKVGI